MGTALRALLKNGGYKLIPLEVTLTQHLIADVKLNKVKGRFIVDTGASQTCIGKEFESYFRLQSQTTEIKAIGAGANHLDTHISEDNYLKVGEVGFNDLPLLLIDMSHINDAFAEIGVTEVQGIIGADILLQCKAIIDYQEKTLYLQP